MDLSVWGPSSIPQTDWGPQSIRHPCYPCYRGQEHTDKNIRHTEDPADKLRAPHFDEGPVIDWMSIKASGGPTHRLRITPYWGPPGGLKAQQIHCPSGPPRTTYSDEGPTDWLYVHLDFWGPHTLTSEGPQIDFTSRPLRAPHFNSELRLTEGPGPCIPTDEEPTDPLSIQATKVPHSYRLRASPYRGPHTPTDEGPHRLTAHLGLWGPHILTEPPSELQNVLYTHCSDSLRYGVGRLRPSGHSYTNGTFSVLRRGPNQTFIHFLFFFVFFYLLKLGPFQKIVGQIRWVLSFW